MQESETDNPTSSCSPQNQADCEGSPGRTSNSANLGKLSESGSKTVILRILGDVRCVCLKVDPVFIDNELQPDV